MNYFDEKEVRKAITQLKPNGQLFEIRIIGQSKPLSAYFTNAEKLVESLSKLHLENTNVYITLNRIDSGCSSRMQYEKFLPTKDNTSDSNITKFDWLFIDIDPVRAAFSNLLISFIFNLLNSDLLDFHSVLVGPAFNQNINNFFCQLITIFQKKFHRLTKILCYLLQIISR